MIRKSLLAALIAIVVVPFAIALAMLTLASWLRDAIRLVELNVIYSGDETARAIDEWRWGA